MTKTLQISLLFSLISFPVFESVAQCADTNNIYTFSFSGTVYEIVKEKKTWVEAAACAKERGGKLVEVDSLEEQSAIYQQITNNAAGIILPNTVAPDGGGGAYLWLGGNDIDTEGDWYWDGDNSGDKSQFWQGDKSGTTINNSYTNWGLEPDDYNGQDALAISLNGWPLGQKGQWNDVDHTNKLFYILEKPEENVGIQQINGGVSFEIYPNPVIDQLNVSNKQEIISTIEIFNAKGQKVLNTRVDDMEKTLDLSKLSTGYYTLLIILENGEYFSRNIVK